MRDVSPQMILGRGVGGDARTLAAQHQGSGIAGGMPFIVGHAGAKPHLDHKLRRAAVKLRSHRRKGSLLENRIVQGRAVHQRMHLFGAYALQGEDLDHTGAVHGQAERLADLRGNTAADGIVMTGMNSGFHTKKLLHGRYPDVFACPSGVKKQKLTY